MPTKRRSSKRRPARPGAQNKRSGKKSSLAARRLIRAALRGRSQREAAKLLRLPTHGQLVKMLKGEIRDTPAMRVALARADKRAARAWSLIKDDDRVIDRDLVCKLIHHLEADLDLLKVLCTG